MALQACMPILRLVLFHKHQTVFYARMAGDAPLYIEGCKVLAMAAGAVEWLVIGIFLVTYQAEAGCYSMIEVNGFQLCRQPTCGGVALLASRIEKSPVDFRLGVAVCASGRRVQEGIVAWATIMGSDFTKLMACHTIYLPMDAVDWKTCILVVEAHHAVLSIMAQQACVAMALGMLAHERCIPARMAVHTRAVREGEAIFIHMAGAAVDRLGVVVHLMPIQAEICVFVSEMRMSALGDIKISPVMVCMAVRTLVCVLNAPVSACLCGDLLCDVGVARQTKLHLRSIQGRMAKLAALLKFGMG